MNDALTRAGLRAALDILAARYRRAAELAGVEIAGRSELTDWESLRIQEHFESLPPPSAEVTRETLMRALEQ